MRILFGVCFYYFLAGSAVGDDLLISNFESDNYGDWKLEGDAFGAGPIEGARLQVSGYRGRRLVNSFDHGDESTGELTSPPFRIESDYISFLIGGGDHPGETGIELLVGGKTVHSATGNNSGGMVWRSWNVSTLKGEQARLRIFDRAKGDWGHINIDEIIMTGKPRSGTGAWRLEEYRRSPQYYTEQFRPQFHFTPELNWMNDPNGLVYFEGEYHLFYQHNPLGNEWGHMSWGHAVSSDLLHWQHLPIALRDEYGVMIFSGSAVADTENTSGFGTRENPPLVAIYTGHRDGLQTQDIAYSTDRGRSWTKYSGNPVIDIGQSDFRDPKVFWHESTGQWVMIVSLATEKRLQIYASPDLKNWSLLSEFGPAGVENKANWECPDLFELPVLNEPGQTRWVLEADMGSGSIAGGSGGEYFTGVFDGEKFVADSQESQWVDFGRDFYAPVSWSGIPVTDGRRIWIGWMNNWETCLNPTYPWRSAMSIPREVTLNRINGVVRMCQQPVREIESLRDRHWSLQDYKLEDRVPAGLAGQQLELILEVSPESSSEFGVHVLKSGDLQTTVGYDVNAGTLFIDRRNSGSPVDHPAFPGRHPGPLSLNEKGQIRLRILVDGCSVEVFGNLGETVLTDLVFPGPEQTQVEFYSAGGSCRIVSCEIHTLKSVWTTPPRQE